ncbi:MAG: hypothetical protein KG028_04770 [Actinobacteria bacterium]|jgi:hypothetical protein|nr:hypothetical protein [Actinomycetota bacterium]
MSSHDEMAGVLDDIERLRTRVRADRRETSVPLLVLGTLALLSSVMANVAGGLLLAVPAVLSLFGLALYYQHRERRIGIGTAGKRWTTAGLGVLGVCVLVPGLAMLFLPPVAIVGIVVTVIGVRDRNRALIVGGSAAAVIAGLEQWYVISNRFWGLAKLVGAGPLTWWVTNAQQFVFGSLAGAFLATGVVALRQERRRA